MADQKESVQTSSRRFSAQMCNFSGTAKKFGLKAGQKLFILPAKSTRTEFSVVPEDVDVNQAEKMAIPVPAYLIRMKKEEKEAVLSEIEVGLSLGFQ